MQKPLTSVPDPFRHRMTAIAPRMNARLRAFLDSFGFRYEFASATELYKSGQFDAMLLRAAEKFDDVMKVMLPTLGDERRRDLFALPADLAHHGPRALRADEGRSTRRRVR